MRKVAAYAFENQCRDAEEATKLFVNVGSIVEGWLSDKGQVELDGENVILLLKDGREVHLSDETKTCALGQFRTVALLEPISSGQFETRICFGQSAERVTVYVELLVGAGSESLEPQEFEIRCPRVVRNIIEAADGWSLGGTPVLAQPVRWLGPDDADRLIQLVWSRERTIPLIVVSHHDGQPLCPELAQDLAKDLSGLAIVCEIDEEASWAITRAKGKEWSCYDGAVRVYWPMNKYHSAPFKHQLWTLQKLLSGVADGQDAGQRIRRQLRRRILGLSAFALSEPDIIVSLNDAVRAEDEARLIKSAEDTGEYRALADSYAHDNDQLRQRNKELVDQVRSLQAALSWNDEEQDVEPAEEVPPATVMEAVDFARNQHPNELLFGGDVENGVRGLAPNAGPPEKVLTYLRQLAEMSKAREAYGLGKSVVSWLKERGVEASTESETTRKAGGYRFDDGGGSSEFELHLKPSNATSPDRCVRIYFKFSEKNSKVIVGWVGRHP